MRISIYLLLAMSLASVCLATIINIPADYPTIQAGINASSDGDTVLVADGRYLGEGNRGINFAGKSIELRSHNGPEHAIIDCLWSDRGFTFISGEDSTAVVDGFTITRGLGPYLECCEDENGETIYFDSIAGGILCADDSSPKIVNCIVSGCSSICLDCYDDTPPGYGGGIGIIESSPIFENCVVQNNVAHEGSDWQGNPYPSDGGGIYCEHSSPIFRNCIIGNNIAGYGGGINCRGSSSIIVNCVILANEAPFDGGGLYCSYSDLIITNNVIYDNEAQFFGGGIYFDHSEETTLSNSILWGNHSNQGNEIHVSGYMPTISFCNIRGGWEGEGNIDMDPLFRDPGNSDYHLMSTGCGDSFNSPCIDTGHPDSVDSNIDCMWGLGAERADMGAFGGGAGSPTKIDESENSIPGRFSLMQNYPNPFNNSTIIEYALPEASDVTIDIYDILGRRVMTFIQGMQEAGSHQIVWDAAAMTSGVYFYSLRTSGSPETKRMTLVK